MDCQAAVEPGAAVVADLLLGHDEGDGLHRQAEEIQGVDAHHACAGIAITFDGELTPPHTAASIELQIR